MPQPYKVFTIYAREDAQYLEELRGQLRPLENAGRITVWSDREINPGADWEKEIVERLDTADVILILVSSAYFNSAFIHKVELKYALARHERGEAHVLPIIVRPCAFGDDPVISRLQVLPTDGKAVTDRRYWPSSDDAWLDVVTGLKRTLAQMQSIENKQLIKENRVSETVKQQPESKIKETAAPRQRKPKQEAPAAVVEVKATDETSSSWWKYALAAVAIIVLVVWVWPAIFKVEQTPPEPGSNFDTIQPKQGSKTISPSALPPNVTVGNTGKGLIDYPMVVVEGGKFTMGSPSGETGRSEEECAHSITIGSFSIGKYEVTQAQWRSIMGNNPSKFTGCDNCPVEQVSWDEVKTFIEKLNAKSRIIYRLPNEAEWEYAAKGGNRSQFTTAYAGSTAAAKVAWNIDNALSKTHPVGTKAPNELDLHDMSGNVWEWCFEQYHDYPCIADKKMNLFRTARGGSWSDAADRCRVAARGKFNPALKRDNTGFRLASSNLR